MRAAAAILAAALLAAGCGDGEERADGPETPTPTRTPAAEPTAFAPSAPEPPENGPEAEPGGAGDEEPIRQPVRLTIGEDGITPRRVKVMALFGTRLTVRNTTGREQVVTVLGAEPRRAVSVGSGEAATLDVDALRPGRYVIEGYAAGRATLVSSLDEP